MGSYDTHRKKSKRRFNRLMKDYSDLFYYGCEVDSWMPEITLLPFVSLQWKSDPTWYRVIAPPGSGKSAHLGLIEDYELAYTIDEFTPKSFISGFRGSGGEDPSKLPQFDGKVLIVSDESTLMEQRQEDRNMVQSILRRAYDGKVAKAFGNLKEKQQYTSHFNLLVGSTPQIDRFFLYNQALGERYINFRLQVPNRTELTTRAYKNQFEGFKDRYKYLKDRVHIFLRQLPEVDINEVNIPYEVENLFIKCADFIALIRTHITRDTTGRHVTTLPQAESAGRLIHQMTQTAISSAIIHGDTEIDISHVHKAIYLGIGSVTAVISFILYHIYLWNNDMLSSGRDEWFSIQDIVTRSALGRGSVGRILEDFAIHRVLDIRQGRKRGGRLIEYRLSQHTSEIINDIELFKYYMPPMMEVVKMARKDRVRPVANKKKKEVTKNAS